ncbi:MAG: glycolate oxidase subunit GlcF [Gammaproteobacteria bacterium WSBS_2016_MAG_OTU1]
MQSNIIAGLINDDEAHRARQIIGSCVHCGFCTAGCPTYILEQDERDSPRGRIYLINEMLAKGQPSAVALRHLDRCLTCRACETACPSGVQYGELADIGRKAAEQSRTTSERWRRQIVAAVFGNATLMKFAATTAATASIFLPEGLRQHFGRRRQAQIAASSLSMASASSSSHTRKVIMLEGCVEGAFAPQTHTALAKVLNAMNIGLITPVAGCCGALRFHLGQHQQGLAEMQRNVAAWATMLESGEAEAVIMTSSGCQKMLADYGRLLATPQAKLVSEKTVNIAELIEQEWETLAPKLRTGDKHAVAYHSPCTMQHGLKLGGRVENLLSAAGYEVRTPEDKGVCCGSAGAYSILQPKRAKQLRARKLASLAAIGANSDNTQIATANIGCQLFLTGGGTQPAVHWVELLAEALTS